MRQLVITGNSPGRPEININTYIFLQIRFKVKRGVPDSFSPGSVREKSGGKGGKIVGKKREKEGKLKVKRGERRGNCG